MLAVRMLIRDRTGGLVDHVKILGSFALDESATKIAAPGDSARAEPWTDQGYPFYSGCGVYRTAFELSEAPDGRLLLEVPMHDDVVEVEVNGKRAGVRLWDPYVIDVTGMFTAGVNELLFRVANTPANLLNGLERPSGLAGVPRLLRAGTPEEQSDASVTKAVGA